MGACSSTRHLVLKWHRVSATRFVLPCAKNLWLHEERQIFRLRRHEHACGRSSSCTRAKIHFDLISLSGSTTFWCFTSLIRYAAPAFAVTRTYYSRLPPEGIASRGISLQVFEARQDSITHGSSTPSNSQMFLKLFEGVFWSTAGPKIICQSNRPIRQPYNWTTERALQLWANLMEEFSYSDQCLLQWHSLDQD